MSRRLLSVLALGIVATAAASLLAVSPAFAHARYKSSTPGTGEAITASPAQVEIEFTQEIQKIAGGYGIQVVKDRGLDVTAGPAMVNDADRHKMSVALQPDLTAGRYVVNWTNTSDEDGDAAKGAFSFYLNYQPNAVDLANDAQLATVGFEDVTAEAGTTVAEQTPTLGGSAVSGTPTAEPVTPPAAGPTGGASCNARSLVADTRRNAQRQFRRWWRFEYYTGHRYRRRCRGYRDWWRRVVLHFEEEVGQPSVTRS